MPIYEYLCEKCATRTEMMQSVGAKPLKKCPKCGGKVNKMFHPVGIVFKGSGFHMTDYVHPEREKKAKAKEESAGKAAEESAGKTGDEGSGKAVGESNGKPAGDSSGKASEKTGSDSASADKSKVKPEQLGSAAKSGPAPKSNGPSKSKKA